MEEFKRGFDLRRPWGIESGFGEDRAPCGRLKMADLIFSGTCWTILAGLIFGNSARSGYLDVGTWTCRNLGKQRQSGNGRKRSQKNSHSTWPNQRMWR